MKTFKLGTGSFSIWHHGKSIYASGVFDHQSEADQCAKNLEREHGISCEVKETEAGWNISGQCSKDPPPRRRSVWQSMDACAGDTLDY
jgi:hypothetical protein